MVCTLHLLKTSLSHFNLILGAQGVAQNGTTAFMTSVRDLCRRSGNDWYRIYLVRKICRQYGVEFVQKLLRVDEVRWLFPDKVLHQVRLPTM